jgi:sugar porter (SP) family MFS transporter
MKSNGEIKPLSASDERMRTSEDGTEEEDEIEDPKVNMFYIIFMIVFSAIGGFLFGYDTSVIAGANLYLEDTFPHINNFQKELIVSITLLGAAIGSLWGGSISDKFGRKITIFVADVLFVIGWVIMAITPSILILIVGRFFVGLGVGVAAMVVPVYLAEVSPRKVRGVIVNLNVVFITLGQFIALVVCLMLGNRWRWMLGLAGIPAVIQGIGIVFLPESPRWLCKMNRLKKAESALKQIYIARDYEIEPVLNELKIEANHVKEFEQYSYFELLKQLFTKYRSCLIVGWGLQMFQQLWGINTAMYYGPEIMKNAGFGDDSHKTQTLISSLPLAGVNTIGGIIALFFIDRLGRRWIMLRTLPFVAFFMGIIGLGMYFRKHLDEDNHTYQTFGKWLAAWGLFLYLMSFAIGMGPTPWTVNSEIYPLHLRGIGNSMSSTMNWISNFAVSISFLSLMEDVPFGDVIAFILIMIFSILAFVFIYVKVHETKGLSLDGVLALFVKTKESESIKML